ncbi:MAG: hypothetical protein ABUL60_00405 [Myxococcales bacterium]
MIRLVSSGLVRRRWLAPGIFAVLGGISACSVATNEPTTGSAGGGNGQVSGTGGSASTGAGSGSVLGSSGSGTNTGGSGTVGAAGTTGTVTTAGAGGGSTGAIVPLCTTKAVMQTPGIASFETYDGTTAAADFSWMFGGPTEGMLGVHTSTYSFGDGSATPTLSILAGHGGNYGLTVAVTNATKWGEGFGMYLLDEQYKPGCIDASAYKGVTMWVRGMVPTGTFSFGVSMAQATLPSTTAPGGSCTGTDDTTCKSPTAVNLPVSATWSQVNVLWADLVGGLSGPAVPLAANGDNITGFSFGANLTFMPESEGSMVYVPVPGDVSIVVDDIAFIP